MKQKAPLQQPSQTNSEQTRTTGDNESTFKESADNVSAYKESSYNEPAHNKPAFNKPAYSGPSIMGRSPEEMVQMMGADAFIHMTTAPDVYEGWRKERGLDKDPVYRQRHEMRMRMLHPQQEDDTETEEQEISKQDEEETDTIHEQEEAEDESENADLQENKGEETEEIEPFSDTAAETGTAPLLRESEEEELNEEEEEQEETADLLRADDTDDNDEIQESSLRVSDPADRSEIEAEQMSSRVMTMPEPAVPPASTANAETAHQGSIHTNTPVARQEEDGPEQDEADEHEEARLLSRDSGDDEDDNDVQTALRQTEFTVPTRVSTPLNERSVLYPATNETFSPQCTDQAEIPERSRRIDCAQQDPDRHHAAVSPEITSRINRQRGSGTSLPESTQNFMESRMDADFRDVNIHNNSESHDLSKSLNAKAFTVGNDVFFGAGHYSPETHSGKKLIAHELTHVVQKEPGRKLNTSQQVTAETVSRDNDPDSQSDSDDKKDTANTTTQPPYLQSYDTPENPAPQTANKKTTQKTASPLITGTDSTGENKKQQETAVTDPNETIAQIPPDMIKKDISNYSEEMAHFRQGIQSQQIITPSLENDESKVPDLEQVTIESLLHYNPFTSNLLINSMVDSILRKGGTVVENIKSTTETINSNIKKDAETKKETITKTYDTEIEEIKDIFEDKRESIDDLLDDIKDSIRDIYKDKKKEVKQAGKDAKKRIKQLRKDTKKQLKQTIKNNVKTVETMCEDNIKVTDTRFDVQAESVTKKAKAKTGTYYSLYEAGEAKKRTEAVMDVATMTNRNIYSLKPDVYRAIRGSKGDLKDAFRDFGKDYIRSLDKGINDVLNNIDDTVDMFTDTMKDDILPLLYSGAEQAYSNLKKELTSQEELVVEQLLERKQTALGMLVESREAAEKAVRRGRDEGIKQVTMFVITTVEHLLAGDVPDIGKSLQFTGTALALLTQTDTDFAKGFQKGEETIKGVFSEIENKDALVNLKKEIPGRLDTFISEADRAIQTELSKNAVNVFNALIEEENKILGETEEIVTSTLNGANSDLQKGYNELYKHCDNELKKVIDQALVKNQKELINDLDAKMDKASDNAGWAYHHPVKAFFLGLGKGILNVLKFIGGLICGILLFVVKLLAFLAVLLVAVIAVIVLTLISPIAGLIAAIVLIVGVVGYIVYGIISSARNRIMGGQNTVLAIFASLGEMIGITQIVEGFYTTFYYRTPFKGGVQVGEGVGALALVILTIVSALKGARVPKTAKGATGIKGIKLRTANFFKRMRVNRKLFFRSMRRMKGMSYKQFNNTVRQYTVRSLKLQNHKLKQTLEQRISKIKNKSLKPVLNKGLKSITSFNKKGIDLARLYTVKKMFNNSKNISQESYNLLSLMDDASLNLFSKLDDIKVEKLVSNYKTFKLNLGDDIANSISGGGADLASKAVEVRNSLPRSIKQHGNVGFAEVEIEGLPRNYKAHSALNYKTDKGADSTFSLLKDKRVFITKEIKYNRMIDTEAKILEDIAARLGTNSKITGKIRLYTERFPCDSCLGVIQQFKQRYPNIILEVYWGN